MLAFDKLIAPGPGLLPTETRLPAPPHLIYHLHFAAGPDDQMSVTLRCWLGRELRIERQGMVTNWRNQSNALSSYMAHAYHLAADVEQVVSYVGGQLWELIHSPSLMEAWMQFAADVEEHSSLPRYVMVTGPDFWLPTPLESVFHTRAPGDFLRRHHIPILRKYSDHRVGNTPPVLSNWTIPQEIIVLLGDDSNLERHKHSLDYSGEIKSWLELLQPDKQVTDQDIRLIVSQGAELESSGQQRPCRIKIATKGSLRALEKWLSEQSQPFLFVYVGHGSYQDGNHLDGHLKITCDISVNRNGGNSNSQFDLAELLGHARPTGIFLNCCEGLRNVTFDGGGGIEETYFESNPSLEVLLGYRSQLCDINGRIISAQLVRSSLAGHSLLEFFAELKKVESVAHLSNPAHQKTIRDQVSQMSIVR